MRARPSTPSTRVMMTTRYLAIWPNTPFSSRSTERSDRPSIVGGVDYRLPATAFCRPSLATALRSSRTVAIPVRSDRRGEDCQLQFRLVEHLVYRALAGQALATLQDDRHALASAVHQ